jgi:hypothetical protein
MALVGSYFALCCGSSLLFSFALNWLPLLLGIMGVFGNTIYGMMWTANISGVIANERESGTYDLLCLSPAGALAVCWALCTGRLHRTKLFLNLHFFIRLLTIIALITFLLMLTVPLLVSSYYEAEVANTELFSALMYAIAATAIFYVDHIQSLDLSALIGMMPPGEAQHKSESRLGAVGNFLGWQIASYLIVGVLCALAVLVIDKGLHPAWLSHLSAALFAIIAFVMVRERVLLEVWRRLIRRLNVDLREFDFSTSNS